MDVIALVLLKGAWYSLEQCGRLLSDARILYRAKSYSSAVALAMIGREELGKHRMLLDEWRKSVNTGKYPTDDHIRKACENHLAKQKQALLSLTFAPPSDSVFGTAITKRIASGPQDKEYQEAEKVIKTAVESLAKRAPDDRHEARMRALYVDLKDLGSGWSRPSDMSQENAKQLLNDAANDYSGQQSRLDPGRLRALSDPTLADALQAWPERPALLDPVWPEQ